MLYQELSSKVIAAVITVHKELGGEHPTITLCSISVRNKVVCLIQRAFSGVLQGEPGGEYFSDLVVGGKIIVEVKSVGKLTEVHQAQLVNYLRIAGLRVGLLKG